MSTSLDKTVVTLLKKFGIDCYPIDRNVKMRDLGINIVDENEVIEFDVIAKVGDYGLIFEATTQNSGNKGKIKQFYYNKFKNFKDAHEADTLNLNAFSKLKPAAISKLKKVKNWKALYVGTDAEIINSKLTESKFPNSEDLFIINSEHLKYLKFLADRLGKFGKYEFLRHLDIIEKDPESPDYPIEVKAIQLKNKKISGNIEADVFIFQVPATDLLDVSLVPRYGSLSKTLPEFGDVDYQRLLDKIKLKNIAKIIDKGQGSSTFPNAITIVLSKNVKVSKIDELIKKLTIPRNYGSVEVIDGQHRLFGYVHSKLSKNKLKNSKLIVVGLRFKGNESKRRKQAAKIFIEVNREQTKVKNELIYLLSQPVLRDNSATPLAARVISLLNTEENGPLQNVFHTRPFQQEPIEGVKPVKIVMISDELSKIFNPENEKRKGFKKLYKLFSSSAWNNLKSGKPKKIIEEALVEINNYFKIVKSNFNEDWSSNNSYLYSSKYMMGFVRLFIEYKKKGYAKNTIGKKISKMKTKLLTYLYSKEGKIKVKSENLVFSKNYSNLPDLTRHQSEIADFILKYGI